MTHPQQGQLENHSRQAKQLFTPPRITTFTDDELLEAIGPAVANTSNSQTQSNFVGVDDPANDNFFFSDE